ncbi:putative inorganic phosphate cotransporter [Panulirus ornatus]|uniref:putative inorganic phosphate cotransporter n=1 Tax=Panulirus ornatus TaxID=150431 RepID=UPI003A8796F6
MHVDEDQSYNMQVSAPQPGRTPWKSFLTSVPLWAAHTSQMGSMFGFNLLLTQLPTYMDNILGFSIETNGLLSSLPFLVMFVGANFWGTLGDWLIANHYISRHVSRKLFSSISMVLPGLMLVTVGYVGCNTTLAVTLFTVGMAFSGAVCSGHRVNHIDLAPNFSGTTLGMSNTLAFAVSMCVPVIVGAMTPDQSLHQWQAVFWMAGAVYTIACLVFVTLGSTEIQPWNFEQVMEKRETLLQEEKSRSLYTEN